MTAAVHTRMDIQAMQNLATLMKKLAIMFHKPLRWNSVVRTPGRSRRRSSWPMRYLTASLS